MNAILGAIRGLEYNAIEPFLCSLRQCGYTDQLVFYVAGISQESKDRMRAMGAELLEVEENDATQSAPVNSFRYFVYQQLLAHDHGWDRVFLCDVRDLVFQGDPFAFDCEGKLCCFLEDARYKIENSIPNAGWIAAGFGKEVLDDLRDKPISCSGTTMGPLAAVRDYVDAMVETLNAVNERTPLLYHVIPGIDQGVHNYLLHKGGLPDARLVPNESGPVFTMHYIDADTLGYTEQGHILNAAGRLPAVLHQYDSYPMVERHIRKWLGLDPTE